MHYPAVYGVSDNVPPTKISGLCLRSIENFLCDDKFFAEKFETSRLCREIVHRLLKGLTMPDFCSIVIT